MFVSSSQIRAPILNLFDNHFHIFHNIPVIQLKNATKVYELGGEKIYGLYKVNLKIDQGDFIVVMGPSGSGKSTLANVIGGLDTVDEGEVLVDNQDISRLPDRVLSDYRNKKIGFIFQFFNLIPTYTALENVMVPLVLAGIPQKDRQKRALECLIAVGLEERLNHKPSQLSGGQRQRVCIARALANNPQVIIADEPTGNLDSKKGEEIVTLLKTLNEKAGLTVIIITHDSSIAKQAKLVLTMKDGQLVKGD
jgi:putative ABC transport system ATP-binding protein